MNDRTKLLSLAIAGLTLGFPVSHWVAAQPVSASTRPAHESMSKAGEKDEEHKHGEKGEHDDHEQHGKHEGKEKHGGEHEEQEIETAVPLTMVPQAVLDVVKKEVPTGTIAEAELEVNKGKIVYGFDVKDGTITYDIKVSVDGKFISKAVDDQADDKDEAQEKGEKD